MPLNCPWIDLLLETIFSSDNIKSNSCVTPSHIRDNPYIFYKCELLSHVREISGESYPQHFYFSSTGGIRASITNLSLFPYSIIFCSHKHVLGAYNGYKKLGNLSSSIFRQNLSFPMPIHIILSLRINRSISTKIRAMDGRLCASMGKSKVKFSMQLNNNFYVRFYKNIQSK